MLEYVRLSAAAMLPVIVALIVYYVEGTKYVEKIPYAFRQITIGIIFGILAILGTECGIVMDGAQVNCRDAAVMIPGLLFGGPAGIIAGIIGGVERWFAVAWGIGTYTRVACTVSTILAGFYAAGLRFFLFYKKRPSAGISMACAMTLEIFHLSMVFVTNTHDALRAIVVVKTCTLPMVLFNGLSVFFAVLIISHAAHDHHHHFLKKKSETPIFEAIQNGLLVVLLCCVIFGSFFIYKMEDNMSKQRTSISISHALTRLSDELELQINKHMFNICYLVKKDMEEENMDLHSLALKYEVKEICIGDKSGFIRQTNIPKYQDFDMRTGSQSAAFLCLLQGQKEYAQKLGPTANDAKIVRKYAGIALEDGFLQISYDAKGLAHQVSNEISTIASNRYVGSDGYIIIMDEQGNLISASEKYNASKIEFSIDLKKIPRRKMITIDTTDGKYYLMTEKEEGYYICGIYPMVDADKERDISVYLSIFQFIIIFMIMFMVLYLMIKNMIVNQIVKMADSLSRISQGDLEEEIDVHSNAEFSSLSNDINRTVSTLKQYIDEAAARINAELEMATKIQTSVLPSPEGMSARRDDFDIFAKMDPAKEVGGDFYDFYFTGDNELNVMIADVSGKGIPAAMFMMRAKSVLRNLTEMGDPLGGVFMEANNILCEGNEADMFVTTWQGRIHMDSGLVEYVNAGHNPPVVYRQGKGFEYLLQRPGLVLAAMEDMPYKKNQFQMEPGDILFLYTDGVVEATDQDNQLYGEDRLLRVLNRISFENMHELLSKVRADVDEFVGDAPQFDDLTMVAVRYMGQN